MVDQRLAGAPAPGSRAPREEPAGNGSSITRPRASSTCLVGSSAREMLSPSIMILNLCWVRWDNGGALAYIDRDGRCNWAYCGGGPSYRGVKPTHFADSIASLLGWDHPAARDASAFAKHAA